MIASFMAFWRGSFAPAKVRVNVLRHAFRISMGVLMLFVASVGMMDMNGMASTMRMDENVGMAAGALVLGLWSGLLAWR